MGGRLCSLDQTSRKLSNSVPAIEVLKFKIPSPQSFSAQISMSGRLNVDGETVNLDGGTLTLDGGTCPYYNLSTEYGTSFNVTR